MKRSFLSQILLVGSQLRARIRARFFMFYTTLVDSLWP